MTRLLLLFAALICAMGAAPFDPLREAGIYEHPGAKVPLATAVVDESGRTTTLSEIGHGRPILLVPVLHDCPNLCGATLDGLAGAMREAGVVADRDATVIAFGIDPMESSVDAGISLAKLAERHPELAGRVHATVADKIAIAAVTRPLGYRFAFDPRIGQYAHAAAVAVLTPDGRLARWLYGLAPEPAALRAAISEAREGRTGGWGRQLILLCYHYDPATGRYSLAIDWLLRTAGIAATLLLLLYVVLARRNERGQPS